MMDPKQIAMYTIKFNKTAFDNSFEAMTILQDQTDKVIAIWMEQTPMLPSEVKNVVLDCRKAYKKGYADFKTAVDVCFSRVEDFFKTPKK